MLSGVLCAVMCVTMCASASTTTAYATETVPTFTDVDPGYWAAENIKFAAEHKIVNGYYNAWSGEYTFLPENNVSYEEAATMLWRALEAAGVFTEEYTDEDKTAIVEEYRDQLTAANIAQWAEFYVADLLKRGIIDETELPLFVGANFIGNPAPRIVVALWTAAALDKTPAAAYYLPYTDKESISDIYRDELDILYRYGIMRGSLMLDGTTAFLPTAGVKRSEFAAIANRVYENMKTTSAETGAARDISSEIYTYTSTDNLYLASDFVAVYDGSTVKKVSGGTANPYDYIAMEMPFVLSGFAADSSDSGDDGSLPQLHIDTIPAAGKGKIVSVEEALVGEATVTKVGIEIGGIEIFYIVDENTQNSTSLSKGKKVSFIADGITLIEIQ